MRLLRQSLIFKQKSFQRQFIHGGKNQLFAEKPPCCSDFRYESNGIFVLGVGFFFFRQISTF